MDLLHAFLRTEDVVHPVQREVDVDPRSVEHLGELLDLVQQLPLQLHDPALGLLDHPADGVALLAGEADGPSVLHDELGRKQDAEQRIGFHLAGLFLRCYRAGCHAPQGQQRQGGAQRLHDGLSRVGAVGSGSSARRVPGTGIPMAGTDRTSSRPGTSRSRDVGDRHRLGDVAT